MGGSTFDLLERGAYLARRLGRETAAAEFLFFRMTGAYVSTEKDRGMWARRLHEQGQASADPIIQAYGRQAWGLYQWDIGNIGEAYRCFSRRELANADASASPLDTSSQSHTEAGPLKVPDEWPGWLAVITALHGDVETARDTLEAAYQAEGAPHAVSVWAYYHTMADSMAGDPSRVIRTAEQWIAAGADRADVGHENYVRLDWYWARALTGDDPAGIAAEAEHLLAATLRDPPRWGIAYHYGLIAEMWLAAEMPDEAAAALDRADRVLQAYGQRYAEGLVMLLRARLLHARGEPINAVRAAAEKARNLSDERGAHLFSRRAERFLVDLGPHPSER